MFKVGLKVAQKSIKTVNEETITETVTTVEKKSAEVLDSTFMPKILSSVLGISTKKQTATVIMMKN